LYPEYPTKDCQESAFATVVRTSDQVAGC
jgi:hypothetical protein